MAYRNGVALAQRGSAVKFERPNHLRTTASPKPRLPHSPGSAVRRSLKRLKLRRNNWDSDTYEFDEVLTEFASQKRVYEVVAKPVIEVCSNDNIPIVEDPKTGDVSLSGATLVEIKDQPSFLELLRVGETHRIAANTKLNTESSRSHAILMVHVKRSVVDSEDVVYTENNDVSHLTKPSKPLVQKSKLVVVDLAGSERIHKEAKSINLSLIALGKCINALAENNSHVPFCDSKLTRLLRDSFGGTARTSLIVTIGPSPRHRGETSSTILFGQRAMKVENMLKIKEEFDYESLSWRHELRSQGGIKALLGVVRCDQPDVLSQVARGIANFAKCESRASSQGIKSGTSFLIEDGALPWIVQNANNEAAAIRRHIELALFHMAQQEVNAKDMISGGALWELVRISRDCMREDIRNLGRRTLTSIPPFKSEFRRLHIDV
ncbi:Armadillo repeat-containing kinesin-like protein 2 [Glycine soja]|uniref:Kinesin-like protein n=1 Tax=Glycine soja TaxID=3848 RepID=A0A0B2NUG4_GLYSO|nr:Armadillo repeat-containing kinesin-like protein 2 [Glycine soja]